MCKYLFESCKHYSIWNNDNSGMLCINCSRKHIVHQISSQILLYIAMCHIWSSGHSVCYSKSHSTHSNSDANVLDYFYADKQTK